MDTWAGTPLIQSSFYDENLTGVVGLENVGTFTRIVGVNGLDVPFEGCLEVPITILGQTIKASFLVKQDAKESGVKRNAKCPVILGCYLLRAMADRGMEPLGPSKNDWQLALSWLNNQGEFLGETGRQREWCERECKMSSDSRVLPPYVARCRRRTPSLCFVD